MASYTMQLKDYIEMFSQYDNGLSTRQRIEKGRARLFDFEYPLFDPDYKNVFETHFIRKFYFREIGYETEGAFKFHLETWLQIKMPYFNKLFKSELIQFDPLENSKISETANRKNDTTKTDNRDTTQSGKTNADTDTTSAGTSSTTGSGTASTDSSSDTDATGTKQSNSTKTDDDFKRDLTMETPDTRLTITANDGEGVIEYASKIEESNENNKETAAATITDTTAGTTTETSDTSTTAKTDTNDSVTSNQTNEIISTNTQNEKLLSDINEIEDFIKHTAGKTGVITYSEMLEKYRETFLRIEEEIFKEMQELFMLVY